MPDPTVITSQPFIERAPGPLPDDLPVLYAGDDGHLYFVEDGGRRTRRLSWKNEDFSMLPGLPALPGAAGDLEADWHFAHPTPSPDGARIAAFGLLPADPMDLDGESLGDDWEEELVDLEISDASALGDAADVLWQPTEAEGDDVAGPSLLPVSLPEGDIVAVPLGAVATEEESGEVAYWPGARVYVLHRDGVRVTEAWAFEDGGGVHLDWAPDGRRLLVLTQSDDDLDLHLVDTEGGDVQLLARGAPIFWAWQPRGPRLAMRAVDPSSGAAEVQIIRPLEPGPIRTIAQAGAFYTPAWRPDGAAFVYAAAGDREDRLVLADPEGLALTELIAYPGRAAFRWSRGGERLAVAIAPEGTGPFQILEMVDPAGARSWTVFDQPFLSVEWLPDARRVLVCAAAPDSGQLLWTVVDDLGESRPVGPAFAPSQETLVSLHFFDQVTRDRPFLAPTGSHVVWAGHPSEPIHEARVPGREDVGRDSMGPEGDPLPRILVAPIDTSGPTVSLGTGRFACFSPI